MHYLIVGLGNPGKKYSLTRHNIGFLVVEELAKKLGCQFKPMVQFEAEIAEGSYSGEKVTLLKPQTYMNESGRAVQKVLAYYKLAASNVVVVVDDLDLPFGQERIRLMGSSGGHNGLKSIEQCLATREYTRFRIGIGRGPDVVDHVLGRFTAEEMAQVEECVTDSAGWICKLIESQNVHTLQAAMNKSQKIMTQGARKAPDACKEKK